MCTVVGKYVPVPLLEGVTGYQSFTPSAVHPMNTKPQFKQFPQHESRRMFQTIRTNIFEIEICMPTKVEILIRAHRWYPWLDSSGSILLNWKSPACDRESNPVDQIERSKRQKPKPIFPSATASTTYPPSFRKFHSPHRNQSAPGCTSRKLYFRFL